MANRHIQFKDAAAFAGFLAGLRQQRRLRKRRRKVPLVRRKLTAAQRQAVLKSTAGRCHICGGMIGDEPWQADHVLAHSGGGPHSLDNYLPAHALCNNYRWDYSAEEFQNILRLGVWARTQIELQTKAGRMMGARFLVHDGARQKRRKP